MDSIDLFYLEFRSWIKNGRKEHDYFSNNDNIYKNLTSFLISCGHENYIRYASSIVYISLAKYSEELFYLLKEDNVRAWDDFYEIMPKRLASYRIDEERYEKLYTHKDFISFLNERAKIFMK